MAVAEPLLALAGVEKRYGAAVAVGPIDITVNPGEFLTLLGPSGCGKTTTLNIIAGLITPDAGRVLMNGRDITAIEPRARDMGVVFQSYALFPHKTVFDNVAFGLKMRKSPKTEIAERVRAMLDTVGLPGVETRYPRQLSGGQRQRVAVARALVVHPKVLLLDEPLSNLDAVLRKHMRRELRAIQQRVGITAIFVTHDQEEAFEMSDRVILMNRGRIEQVGTPEDLYDAPRTRFAAEFIGEANVFAGVVSAVATESPNDHARVTVPLANSATIVVDAIVGEGVASGDAVQVIVRPERVGMERERTAGALVERAASEQVTSEPVTIERAAGASGRFKGRVVERVFSGDLVRFTLDIDGGLRVRTTKPNLPAFRDIAVGASVLVTLDHCRAVRPDG